MVSPHSRAPTQPEEHAAQTELQSLRQVKYCKASPENRLVLVLSIVSSIIVSSQASASPHKAFQLTRLGMVDLTQQFVPNNKKCRGMLTC